MVVMVRSALTMQEKAEIWRGYQAGVSLRSISRTLGRSMETLRMFVASTGGRPPLVPRRSALRAGAGGGGGSPLGGGGGGFGAVDANPERGAPMLFFRENRGKGGPPPPPAFP